MGKRKGPVTDSYGLGPEHILELYEELGTWRGVGEALGGYSHAYMINLAYHSERYPITAEVYNRYVRYRNSHWPLKPESRAVALAPFELPSQVMILAEPRQCPECVNEAKNGFREAATTWFVPKTPNQRFCCRIHGRRWARRQKKLAEGQGSLWRKRRSR